MWLSSFKKASAAAQIQTGACAFMVLAQKCFGRPQVGERTITCPGSRINPYGLGLEGLCSASRIARITRIRQSRSATASLNPYGLGLKELTSALSESFWPDPCSVEMPPFSRIFSHCPCNFPRWIDLCLDQWQPSATKCNQWQPSATKCHQWQPSAIKCHQVPRRLFGLPLLA